jgi:predicted GNAT superfamily acetyltransferase
MLTIRPLRHDDTPAVLGLNGAAAPAVFRLDLPELSRLMAISPLHLAAVQSDGTLAGYALAFSSEQPYDGEEFIALRSSMAAAFVYVDQIAIDERARGTGIGRMLYQELASRAQALGATALCCEVNTSPPNPGSLAFHQRMGFTSIGAMDTRDGRGVVLLRWNFANLRNDAP